MPSWNNPKDLFKRMTEAEKWKCKLYGYHAESLLLQAHPEKEEDGTTNKKVQINFKTHNLCADNRRTSTVYKAVQDVVTSGRWEDLTVNQDVFLKEASQYGIKPIFNLSGQVIKNKYGEEKVTPLKNPKQAYRKITDLNYRELIYTYFHQDDYVYHLKKKVWKSNVHSYIDRVSYEMTLFPKMHLDTLDHAIFRSRVEEVARKHATIAIKAAYGIDLKTLHGSEDPHTSMEVIPHEIKGYEGYTKEHIRQRITNLVHVIRMNRKALEEALLLRRSIQSAGGFDKENMIEALTQHLFEEAPLLALNEDQEDLQELAKDMMKAGVSEPIIPVETEYMTRT